MRYKVFTILLVFILLSQSALACQCIIPDLEERFKTTDQIFSAKVLAFDKKDSFYPTYNFGGEYVTLEIISGFKNTPSIAKGIRISVIISDTCPFTFELNKEYIIFGSYYSEKEIIMVSECSVEQLSSFKEMNRLIELSELENEVAQNKKMSISSDSDKTSLINFILGAFLLLSVALNLYFVVRK